MNRLERKANPMAHNSKRRPRATCNEPIPNLPRDERGWIYVSLEDADKPEIMAIMFPPERMKAFKQYAAELFLRQKIARLDAEAEQKAREAKTNERAS